MSTDFKKTFLLEKEKHVKSITEDTDKVYRISGNTRHRLANPFVLPETSVSNGSENVIHTQAK